MFEAIYGLVILGIIIYLFAKRSDWNIVDEWKRNTTLAQRVEKLEEQTRYVADQPANAYVFASFDYPSVFNSDELERRIHANDVPITDVVKAIVKHLGMEIEKVPEQTTKKPQEVKVVEKQPSVTITGMEGTTAATWSSSHCYSAPMPEPKPKRKYTKRKPAVKKGGKKNV